MGQLFKDGSYRDNEGVIWRLDYFVYTTTVTDFLNSSQRNNIINFQADSDFMWCKSRYLALEDLTRLDIPTVDNIEVPNILVAFNDTSSGRNIQNVAYSLESMAPIPHLYMFDLPYRRSFKAKSSLNLSFTNNGADLDYFNFSLVGYKKYKIGAIERGQV